MTDSPSAVIRQFQNLWWLPVVLGLITTFLGFLLLFNLFTAVATLALLVAFGLILTGVQELIAGERYSARWASVVMGLAWIATGVAGLVWPKVTLLALAIVTGIGLLVTGLIQVYTVLKERQNVRLWGLWLVDGTLSVVLGIMALAWPRATILVLAVLLGIRLVFRGAVMTALGFALRSLGKSAAAA